MDRSRVVISGMGVVSALGCTPEGMWSAMQAGRTGIRTIDVFDASDFKTSVGGLLDREALKEQCREAGIRPGDITVDAAMLAARQSLIAAGLLTAGEQPQPQPIATVIGTGGGSTQSTEIAFLRFAEGGPRSVRPTTVPRCMANAVSSQISIRFKLSGPNYITASACTSSTTALGIAFRMVRDGYRQQVLCGGADTVFLPATFWSWNNLGVMSRNPDPAAACRPFDRNRDGCVLGEGAGAVVLETLASAQERGATILGEIVGYGESSDCTHITAPNPDGQAEAIRLALADAGLGPTDVGYISAHGTATTANDLAEATSIRRALGDAADNIPVGALKSYVGHLLGGSGVVEVIATLMALRAGSAPRNLNLAEPDPECSINLVRDEPVSITKPHALKNSFGFGGDNGVLVLKRWE